MAESTSESKPAILARLDRDRRHLLDVSARNRLINAPLRSRRSKTIEVVDEVSEHCFDLLVRQKKRMSFLPGREVDEDESDDQIHLPQPEDDDLGENGVAARHVDNRLQTRLTSEGLQKRLLSIFYDARTLEEEQGVNVLFLALGFLKWYESDASDVERFAPLLLIPVELDRKSTNSRFRISMLDDDITTNLSLQAKLKAELNVNLPDVPEIDDLSPNSYFDMVQDVIGLFPRWEVCRDDILLGFFSFSKFLMYRDLNAENWPEGRQLEEHGLLTQLLETGFQHEPPLCDDDDRIDQFLPPLETIHVMDADSSQALVVEEVRRGRNLVIQGPPGTGKSQTITNLIATAVKDGRSVLFVAEKMAALEVVKSRLDRIGLGAMCLEVHSHKANKKKLLQELGTTLELRKTKPPDVASQAEQLSSVRDELNQHADVLHLPLETSDRSAYEIIGELVRLHADEIGPADFDLEEPLTWTRDEFERKTKLLDDFLGQHGQVGDPQSCPWRGVGLNGVIRSDMQRLTAQLPSLTDSVNTWMAVVDTLTTLFELDPETDSSTQKQIAALARLADRVVNAPPMDRSAIASEVWNSKFDQIEKLVQRGAELQATHGDLKGIVADVAWDTDVEAARRELAAHGRSWLRWFRKSYREAQATLRGLVASEVPKDLHERIRILDSLIKAQKLQTSLNSADTIGSEAFGAKWNGAESDWVALRVIYDWVAESRTQDLPGDIRQISARSSDVAPVRKLLGDVAHGLEQLPSQLNAVFEIVALQLPEAFGVEQLDDCPVSQIAERLVAWSHNAEGISHWVQYRLRRSKLSEEGLGELAARLNDGRITRAEAQDRFHSAYFDKLLREVFRQHPSLARFDGQSYERVRQEFVALDLQRIDLARREVAAAHFSRIPSGGEVGEMKTVRREIKKKSRHMAIRRLLSEAGHAIQGIKPVFMMSPISVAQFLEPGILEFDLLLIDEASQIQPVDALGAVARCRQIVVVGDDKQLPPTRFFNALLADDPEEEDSEAIGDLESILGLCSAHQMPQRMLRWHYRSRHHSLIAVSNHEFYRNRLFVFPSPDRTTDSSGLRFHHIADGVFDRGGKAVNQIEANAVATAVIEHARQHPHVTLGVGTFSVAQRNAVLFELERLTQNEPGLQEFFMSGRDEHFFVKNLENVQGDERDVIFISIGYGKDASGYMGMNFGPLSNEGGERRLNVLISRARQRCEVFSSITADNIDLNRAKSAGAKSLKTFLRYAQSGVLDVAESTLRESDATFERQVALALETAGYEVDTQVGVAGFFIDVAVVDAEHPGRYVLGIECDGAAYHASRSARDRDRLRQQVLEDRGWCIHRIWSTDWYQRPEEQLRRTVEAIEQARLSQETDSVAAAVAVELDEPAESAAESTGEGNGEQGEVGNGAGNENGNREQNEAGNAEEIIDATSASRDRNELQDAPVAETREQAASDGAPIGKASSQPDDDESESAAEVTDAYAATPYVEASFVINEPHGITETDIKKVARRVSRVVGIESPIHREEVVRRVASLWGTKAGKRIADTILEAVTLLVGRKEIEQDGDFLFAPGEQGTPIRDRAEVTNSTLKQPENLPPVEIRAALQSVIKANVGATMEDVVNAASRLFGFKSTRKQLRSTFTVELEQMITDGVVEQRNEKVYGSREHSPGSSD